MMFVVLVCDTNWYGKKRCISSEDFHFWSSGGFSTHGVEVLIRSPPCLRQGQEAMEVQKAEEAEESWQKSG